MAVKYSKQRDFGVKNRKTRKLGNKMFTLRNKFKTKTRAKQHAKSLRGYRSSGRSYLVRVVKLTKGYGVYTHRKS
jgi:hypothetical protein